LEDTFDPHHDFDIQTYLAQETFAQPQFYARLCFPAQFAWLALDNRPSWEEIAEQPDGSVIVTFAAANMEFAVSTVLAYSGSAIALEPPELCLLVRERAEAIEKQYSNARNMS
jgi:predicted DNA-binding transcriptional regulator YafY